LTICRIVLDSYDGPFSTQNLDIQLDTVQTSPSNRILLLPEPGGGGPPIEIVITVPSNNWSIPTSTSSHIRLTGPAGTVLDVEWNDGGTNTYTMTGSPVSLSHTYATAGNYTITINTDTDQLTAISTRVVPTQIETDIIPANITNLSFNSNSPLVGLTGAISNLPTNLTDLGMTSNDYSSLTGTIAQFGSSLEFLNFSNGSADNTAITGTIANLASSALTWISFDRFINLTGTIDSFASTQTTLETLNLEDNGNITGSISNLPSTMRIIYIRNQTGIAGNISSLASGLWTLYLNNISTTLTGSISSLPSGLESLTIISAGTNLTGSINSLPTSLHTCILTSVNTGNNLTGSLDGTLPANLASFELIGVGSGMTGGNIANLSNCRSVELTGFSCSYSYTSTTWTRTGIYLIRILPAATYGLTTTQVDNLLIDLSTAPWAGSGTRILNLGGNNSARSAASDSAVAILLGLGVTVTTN